MSKDNLMPTTAKISFPHTLTESFLRNGYSKTQAVGVRRTLAHDHSMNEVLSVIELEAINTRNQVSSGFIRIPNEESVLRELAQTLNQMADDASGCDLTSRINALSNAINTLLEDGSCTDEDLTELLDDLVHEESDTRDASASKEASNINNQGRDHQIRHLVRKGCEQSLWKRLSELTSLSVNGLHALVA